MRRQVIPRGPALAQRSSRGWAGALIAVGSAFTVFSGCSTILGIDVPPVRSSQSLGGEGGAEAGSAGSGAFPGGEGGNGLGASGGSGAGRAGSGGKGGKGGSPSHGGNAGTTSSEAGRAGEEPARAGNPCDHEGALACALAAARDRLFCEGGRWTERFPCSDGRYCDRRSGACGVAYDGCTGDTKPGAKHCGGLLTSDLVTCGPDLVTAEIEHCVFGCSSEKRACLQQYGTRLQLEQPPRVTAVGAFWPAPPSGDTQVPVCVTNPEATLPEGDEDSLAKQVRYVRDEVESTWGRYGGVAFTGWGPCESAATGVKLSLVGVSGHDDPCTAELGGIDRVGYPGKAGSLDLRLCIRFRDTNGDARTASEELLRIVARHEFGHALGFDDLFKTYDDLELDFMTPAVDTARLTSYPFEHQHIWGLQQAYGRKPSGALVAPNGHCVARTSNGELALDVCDASPAQQFRFVDGQLAHEATATCLRADPGDGAVSLSTCTAAPPAAEQSWQLGAVQVWSYGGLCLGTPSGELKLEACRAGDPEHLWDVDWLDDGTHFRFREPETELCVDAADDFSLTEKQCDGTCIETDENCAHADRFDSPGPGQVAIEGRCLSTPDPPDKPPSNVALVTCSFQPRMVWNLSGRIVGGTNQVLARSEDAGSVLLVAQPLTSGEPLDNEIFDYYLRTEP